MPGPGWKSPKLIGKKQGPTGYVGGKPGRSMGSGASPSSAAALGLTYTPTSSSPSTSYSSAASAAASVAAAAAVAAARQERRQKQAKRKRKRAVKKFTRSGEQAKKRRAKSEKRTEQFKKNITKKRTKVAVPEIVPPKYRKAVAKQGQRLNDALKESGSKLSGPEYLAKLVEFESGWNKKAENPSSAYGYGQFIDSTAEDFRSRLGVETQDPKRPKQMLKGAAMHASGKYGYNPLYAGYNPGYSDTDPIPSVDSGANIKVKVPKKAVKRLAAGTKGPKAAPAAKPVSLKTLKKHVQFTEPKSEVRAEQGAPARSSLTGMGPSIQRALVKLSKQTGSPVRINEGYRTEKRANEFPSGTGSQHHQGNAADVDNHGDYTAEDLRRAGLTNTAVAGELWHFQPLELSPSSAPISGTTTSSTPSSGGAISPPGGSTTTSPTGTTQPDSKRPKQGRTVSQVLAAIDARFTTPLTTEIPDIDRELVERILARAR